MADPNTFPHSSSPRARGGRREGHSLKSPGFCLAPGAGHPRRWSGAAGKACGSLLEPCSSVSETEPTGLWDAWEGWLSTERAACATPRVWEPQGEPRQGPEDWASGGGGRGSAGGLPYTLRFTTCVCLCLSRHPPPLSSSSSSFFSFFFFKYLPKHPKVPTSPHGHLNDQGVSGCQCAVSGIPTGLTLGPGSGLPRTHVCSGVCSGVVQSSHDTPVKQQRLPPPWQEADGPTAEEGSRRLCCVGGWRLHEIPSLYFIGSLRSLRGASAVFTYKLLKYFLLFLSRVLIWDLFCRTSKSRKSRLQKPPLSNQRKQSQLQRSVFVGESPLLISPPVSMGI